MTDRDAAEIVARVARHFRMSVEVLLSRSRRERLVMARWIAMWLLERAGASPVQVGRAVARDHATVWGGLKAVRDLAAAQPWVLRLVAELEVASMSVSRRALVAAGAGL